MLARAALTLSLALPSLALAQGFEYAPGNAQFRITQKVKVSQEVMGNKQEGESNGMQLFSLALSRPARDTALATYTVDSVYATTMMGTVAPFLDRMKGMKVEVRLNPTTGVVYSSKGPTDQEVPNAGALVTALGNYLPKMRPALAKGATWSDTTVGKVNQFGLELDRKVFSRTEVLKDTTIGGAAAWKLQRNDSTTIAGAGNTPNGPVSMEGSTRSKSTFFMTARGALLGGESGENGGIRMVLSTNGMEVNVTTSTEVKIEKVK